MKDTKSQYVWVISKLRSLGPSKPYQDMQDQARKQVPWNFWVILISQFLNKLASTLASAKIVLPWVMSAMGAPIFLTGMLVPIRESGSLLPQVLIGGIVKQAEIRKTFFVLGLLTQGGCIGLIALISIKLQGLAGGLAVIASLVVFSLARGVCSLTSKDILGKTIPEANRGRLLGLSGSLAGLVSIATGVVLVSQIFSASSLPITLLLLACGCWGLAALIYWQVREFASDTESNAGAWHQVKHSARLMRNDPPFRRFVLVRTLMMSSSLSAPYFILLAQPHSGANSVRDLGLFIIVSGIASFLSGVVWGRMADRSSRRVLLITAGLTASLCLTAAFIDWVNTPYSLVFSVGLFFLLMVTHQGVRLGRKTFVIDLADGNDRTQYVATSNSIIGVLLLFTGLIGAFAAQYSLSLVLTGFAAMALLAMALGRSLPEVETQS